MDRPYKEMGERIRQARSAKRLTQQNLADALNISVQSVSQWETGRNQPETDRLIALADILGKPWDWLKTGAEGGLIMIPMGRSAELNERFAPLMALGDVQEFLRIPRPRFPEDFGEDAIVCRYPAEGRLFSFLAPDNAFSPAIREGDLIICDSGVPVRTGDYIVAREWVDEKVAFLRVLGIELGSEERLKATIGTGGPKGETMKVDMNEDLDRIFGVMVEQRRFRFR